MKRTVRLSLIVCALVVVAYAGTASAQYSYYPLTPCRVVDTRNAAGLNGGPAIGPNTTRGVAIKGYCGVPSTAKAVSLNLTITGSTAGSWIAIWPAGQGYAGVSTINFNAGDTLANGAIVGVGGGTPDLNVYNASGSVDVIIDVTGYFQ